MENLPSSIASFIARIKTRIPEASCVSELTGSVQPKWWVWITRGKIAFAALYCECGNKDTEYSNVIHNGWIGIALANLPHMEIDPIGIVADFILRTEDAIFQQAVELLEIEQ